MLIRQPLLEVIQVLTHHLFKNLIHAKDKISLIDTYTSILCAWFPQSAKECSWLLQILSDKYKCWTETILLHCPVIEVCRNFVHVLTAVFWTMTSNSKEQNLYGVEKPASCIPGEEDDGTLALGSDNGHKEI
eukprot:14865196-Ditylum_brightwellii.AAC.1